MDPRPTRCPVNVQKVLSPTVGQKHQVRIVCVLQQSVPSVCTLNARSGLTDVFVRNSETQTGPPTSSVQNCRLPAVQQQHATEIEKLTETINELQRQMITQNDRIRRLEYGLIQAEVYIYSPRIQKITTIHNQTDPSL